VRSSPARPHRGLVNGDGGFMMNVQELATIARCRLPVKIVLLDNSALGMVRQWQELFFERATARSTCPTTRTSPRWRVFGIPAQHIERATEVEGALADLLASARPGAAARGHRHQARQRLAAGSSQSQ
jgi:acetolactate synthase-1/2/3 large subunit